MLSLLLVDHESNFRTALAIALRLERHVVVEAADPATAGRHLLSRSFDAVGIHLTHPSAAPPLVQEIRERLPSCKIVISSAHREILAATRPLLEDGVVELRRPFTAATFLEAIRARKSP